MNRIMWFTAIVLIKFLISDSAAKDPTTDEGNVLLFQPALTRRTMIMPEYIYELEYIFKIDEVAPGYFLKPPKQFLNLTLKSFKEPFNCYVMYTTAELQEEPTSITWNCADNSIYYTFFFSNLEEVHLEMLWNKTEHHTHWWLIVNVHDCNVWKGDVILPYKAPEKLPWFGSHLNVYFLYEQPGKLNVNLSEFAKPGVDIRESFSIHDFVKKYKLGDLEAGNFFRYYGPYYENRVSKRKLDPDMYTHVVE